MAENQTVETDASVEGFLGTIENPTRRADAHALLELMQRATGTEPKMWGSSLIGFGKYRYHYDSGRKGEWMRVGFSPRKANLALHLISRGPGFEELLARLGKHRTGVSCLYINKLADVDSKVLQTLIEHSWESARRVYGEPE
jgi:hypothetical protein